MKRDLLRLWDLSAEELHQLLARTAEMKEQWARGDLPQTLARKTLGLLFTKPSTRTRVSFEVGMYRLGGQCIFMTEKETQLSRAEALSDAARVFSRYLDGLVVRTYDHADVEEMARYASIPIINGLTDLAHPCQVLSDLFTVKEKRGGLEGLKAVWVGDGNNVAHSWMAAAGRLGFQLTLSYPDGYGPDPRLLEEVRIHGEGKIRLENDPLKAVADADVINTDVWVSMGQDAEAAKRRRVFKPYQVNRALLAAAPQHALVLHCLPAHRGEEITDRVIDGPQSVVFDQAENRLHAQMALLDMLM